MSWNKPFEAAYRELYDDWMANGEKSYTPSGNVRAPSEDVVHKSFKTCGISVRTDGSEDSEIHCLRSGVLPEEAADELAQQTAVLVAAEDEDVDPFADLEDEEEELEMNEVVIEEETD